MGLYADQLAQINKAIGDVLTRGQRISINDREIWRADLATLHAERKRLEPLAQGETGGGIRVRRISPL